MLPQCWEQVSHKHPERRQLIAQVTFCLLLLTHSSLTFSMQVVGLLASHVQTSIRGSLLVSLLLQLVDDRDPGVAQTAVRSLALLVHVLDDGDKLSQVTKIYSQHVFLADSFSLLSCRCLSKQ